MPPEQASNLLAIPCADRPKILSNPRVELPHHGSPAPKCRTVRTSTARLKPLPTTHAKGSHISLTELLPPAYTEIVPWTVEYTDQFEEWWNALDAEAQEDIDVVVRVLESMGSALTRPYADTVKDSRHPNMRELRVQSQGRPLRILYAFDPRRTAILLIGGDKTGLTDERFYGTHILLADRLYDEHLEAIKRRE